MKCECITIDNAHAVGSRQWCYVAQFKNTHGSG